MLFKEDESCEIRMSSFYHNNKQVTQQTLHLNNVGSKLGQRRKRCTNIDSTLDEWVVSDGKVHLAVKYTIYSRTLSYLRSSSTLNQTIVLPFNVKHRSVAVHFSSYQGPYCSRLRIGRDGRLTNLRPTIGVLLLLFAFALCVLHQFGQCCGTEIKIKTQGHIYLSNRQ